MSWFDYGLKFKTILTNLISKIKTMSKEDDSIEVETLKIVFTQREYKLY